MVSHARASAPQKQVQGTALLPDSETLWAGSYTGERYRIRNAKPQLHYKASSPIRSLLRIGNTLWIGLQDGLLRLVLTANGQPPSVQQEALPEHFIIWSQYHDTTGHWLETNQGLWLRLQHRWLHWDEVDGLPSRTIYGILPNATTLWLSTNQGLVRVFTDSLPKLRFRTYTASEGLGITEFNQGAYFADPNGYLFFGSTHGVVWFNPQTITPYPFAPNPVILAILRLKNTHLIEIPYTAQLVRLAPGEASVGFVFRGLFLSFPERVRYRVILPKDKRDEILDLNTRNQLVLSGLRPGYYTLMLEAIGPDGQQSRLPQPLPIEVLPHFWETRLFRWALFLLLLVLSGGLIFYVLSERYRRLLLVRQALEQKNDGG